MATLKKAQIENILHQRDPYLMVDEVLELNETMIETQKNHTGHEPYVKGHFPGMPVVPGAMLQEMCTQSAGILITKFYSPVENYNSQTTKDWALGVLKKVHYAKFLSIVKPEKAIFIKVELEQKVDDLFKFRALVTQDNEVKAKLSFNLVNISDKLLQ